MGKRIKLIYILSLFSALMAISVQAYWLYNQYRYEVERYADEIAADVLRVGDEEFAERRKMAIGDDTSYIIDSINAFDSTKTYHEYIKDAIDSEPISTDYARLPNIVADRAICDEDGRNIKETYVTKEYLFNLLGK